MTDHTDKTEQPKPVIPDGYRQNALGHLVPEDQIRQSDLLRDQVAGDLAKEGERISEWLKEFKTKALADLSDLVTIAADKYQVQIGGSKGNLSITTYDGGYKIQRTYRDLVTFTEEIEAARELVNACIIRWSEGANPHIRVLVDRAFRTDKKGNLKTGAVLELLRIEIDDDQWKRAMEALKDSLHSVGTAVYIRIYRRREDSDQYDPIPLDLAAV